MFARLLSGLQALDATPVRVRRGLLRWMGVSLPKSCAVHSRCFFGGPISLGEKAYVSVGVFFDGSAPVHVGDDVHLAPYVRIVTSTHAIGGPEQRAGARTVAPVTIGRGCWLGVGVVVLPGVTIAPGCVVAAGSVVIRDTEPDGLYAGVPAQRKRTLDQKPQ